MRATLFDARAGKLRPLEASAPPRLRWARTPSGAPGTLGEERARLLGHAIESALVFMGYALHAAGPAELCFGGAPEGEALWLKPGAGPAEALTAVSARGFTAGDLRLWVLRFPYRDSPALDWDALDAARRDREVLARALAGLLARHSSSAPNASGLAGYRQRLREALSRDFDFPEALAALWDGLRPGALSPGSQLAVLREADAALGLGLSAVPGP